MIQVALLPEIAAPEIERTALLSRCGKHRWKLGRRWGNGPAVRWVMLNPSTADAEADDPTVREVIRFSRLWGYDAATIVNLYPFRSSSPAECRRWAETAESAAALGTNRRVAWFEAWVADLVVLAWGAAPWATEWAREVLEDLPDKLYCLGTNADGSPKHPLARGRHRIPREQRPIPYRVDARALGGGR